MILKIWDVTTMSWLFHDNLVKVRHQPGRDDAEGFYYSPKEGGFVRVSKGEDGGMESSGVILAQTLSIPPVVKEDNKLTLIPVVRVYAYDANSGESKEFLFPRRSGYLCNDSGATIERL